MFPIIAIYGGNAASAILLTICGIALADERGLRRDEARRHVAHHDAGLVQVEVHQRVGGRQQFGGAFERACALGVVVRVVCVHDRGAR